MHPHAAPQAVRRTAVSLNRRIIRTDKMGQSDVVYDDYYNYDWQLIETRKDGDADPYIQYVWGRRYIDDLVCRYYDPNVDDNVQTHYYLNDANMNVTCLIDANGDAVERYDYAPYGKVAIFDEDWSSQGASAYGNAILFAGYRHDAESGLYHVRNRMYHPTLGRWLQRDFIHYIDGMNTYAYVRLNPLRNTDTTGMCTTTTTQRRRDNTCPSGYTPYVDIIVTNYTTHKTPMRIKCDDYSDECDRPKGKTCRLVDKVDTVQDGNQKVTHYYKECEYVTNESDEIEESSCPFQ